MSVEIVGVGMVTPLGLNAPAAAAAVRAGLAGMRASPVRDLNLDPLTMGLVDEAALPAMEAPGASARHARILRLAAPAAAEAARGVADQLGSASLGVGPEASITAFVGLPEPPRDRRDPIGAGFLADLARAAAVPLDAQASRVFRQGRAAGIYALEAALAHLARARVRGAYALVGAVDTYLDLRLLAELSARGRVRTRGVSDAFIPGEGAGFLLLRPTGHGPRLEGEPLAEIVSAATGFEPGHLESDEIYRGEGLAEAVSTALARAPAAPPVRTVYASFNGESYWAKEWGVARIRSASRFAAEVRLEHPADCLGDPGAAAGGLLLGLLAKGLSRGYRKGSGLVFCSADRGERGAAVLCNIRR